MVHIVFHLFDFGRHLQREKRFRSATHVEPNPLQIGLDRNPYWSRGTGTRFPWTMGPVISSGNGLRLTAGTDRPSSWAIFSQRPGVPPGNFTINLLRRLRSSSVHPDSWRVKRACTAGQAQGRHERRGHQNAGVIPSHRKGPRKDRGTG